eukprot:SAG11_NODE_234_length_11857_cov_15.265776_12_plen_86_part_00
MVLKMATCLVAANSAPSDPQGQRPRVGKPARSPSGSAHRHRRLAGLCARAAVGEMDQLCAPREIGGTRDSQGGRADPNLGVELCP